MVLKSQERKLFEKLSDIIANKLKWLTTYADPKWTGVEIEQIYGLQRPRQSELIGRLDGKYQDKRISKNDFLMLLGRRFMKLEEFLKSDKLTEEEKQYLKETYGIIANQELREMLREYETRGLDPIKTLKENLEK